MGQPPGDGQPQPRAAILGVVLSGGLLEGAKQARLEFLADAFARVRHGNAQVEAGVPARADRSLHQHIHRAPVGELDGVANQVGQDLTQTRMVQPKSLGQVGGDKAAEYQPLLGGPLREHMPHLFDQSAGRAVFRFDFQLAGLDLGEVEHVVDQA